MKNGKRPNRAQKQLLMSYRFNPEEWLISKNTSSEMVIIHRYTGKIRSIPKGGMFNE